MSKIEQHLETVDLSHCPHVFMYGEQCEKKWKGVAVITTEVDDDVNDSYTEMDEDEKTTVRRLLQPYQVKFYPPLMRTFSEWMNGIPPRKNPITGKVYRNL